MAVPGPRLSGTPSACRFLGAAEILGYEHHDAPHVENYGMRLWIFTRCRRCGYESSWKKLMR